MALSYFPDIFKGQDSLSFTDQLSQLETLLVPDLKDDDIPLLMKEISLLEVKQAILDLPKDSAPEPYGFHDELYQ